ncbi:MAG: hypothetical protein ACO23O_14035 [Ilumatobacteraceae bacterium]
MMLESLRRSSARRLIVASAVAVVSVLASVGTAEAGTVYPPPPDGALVTETDDGTVIETDDPDFVVKVGCKVPETVRLTFNGVTYTGQCVPKTAGGARNGYAMSIQFDGVATFTIPTPQQPGDYVMVIELLTSGITYSTVITVFPAGTGATIPKAGGGSATGDLVRSGIGILLVGAAMATVASRRRHSADERPSVDAGV